MKINIKLANITLIIVSKDLKVIETRNRRIIIERKNSDGFTPYSNTNAIGYDSNELRPTDYDAEMAAYISKEQMAIARDAELEDPGASIPLSVINDVRDGNIDGLVRYVEAMDERESDEYIGKAYDRWVLKSATDR